MRNLNDNKIREENVKKFTEINGEYLYHYTSLATLKGILINKELWLGNTNVMNDKNEIKYFVEQLHKLVLGFLADKEKCNEFFNLVYERLTNEYPYAICFSKKKDDAAQWERYADEAKGVCIVFDAKKFMTLIYYAGVRFSQVFYNYEISEHEYINDLVDYFQTGKLPKFYLNEKGFVDNILVSAYFHKHRSFESESEIRLVNLWYHKIKHSNICFETINGTIRKVLKLSLEQLCNDENIKFEDLISEIVIGPRSTQSASVLREYIECELGYKNLAKKISVSECPLR